MTFDITIDGKLHRVQLERGDIGARWQCMLDGQNMDVDVVEIAPDVLSLVFSPDLGGQWAGRSIEIERERMAGEQAEGSETWTLAIRGRRFTAEVRDPRALRSRRAAAAGEGPKKLTAPMPGKIVRLLAREGDPVEAGAGLLVIEAMKMQNELKSPKTGVVRQLSADVGATVNAGDVLAVVE